MTRRANSRLKFHVPPPPDGGVVEVFAASRLTAARYEASLHDAERRNTPMLELLSRQALDAKVGTANLRRFQEFSRAQRASNYGLGTLARDRQAPARLAAARRRMTADAARLMEAAGVQRAELHALSRSFMDRVGELNARPPRGKGRLELVPESAVPATVRRRTANPFVVRTPPFDGWEWWYSWWWDGYGDDPEFIHYTDPATGSVGHRSQWEVWDAGNWDFYAFDIHSSVGFWFKTATPGKLDMWIKNRCGRARYKVYWYDEAGFSDFSDNMFSSWTVNLSAGTSDEDETAMWEMHFHGPNDEEKTSSGDIVSPNTEGWLHMTTSDAIPANVWMYVKIGTHDTHQMLSNDVSLDSIMKNRWYFEEVHYETVD
jgi:hypothetical protein